MQRLERVASEATPLLDAALEEARGQRAELNKAEKLAQLARGKSLKPFLAAGTSLTLARHLVSLGILTAEKNGGSAGPNEGSQDAGGAEPAPGQPAERTYVAAIVPHMEGEAFEAGERVLFPSGGNRSGSARAVLACVPGCQEVHGRPAHLARVHG